MWYVTIDAISVKEIDKICMAVGRDMWNDAACDSIDEANELADRIRDLAPLALIEVTK